MAYNTALRRYTAKRIEEIRNADILIGIPCYNNEKAIGHVLQMVPHGLDKHYRDYRSVIFVADGGSTDDTREAAKEFQIKPWQEKIVSIYRGPAGKGTALRSVFEAARTLQVRACAVVDADLRSITSDWIQYLLDPVISHDFQFVAPVYLRHKYDATITNNVVYNFTRALYGKRIRQPIGGDFAFSRDVGKFFAEQDVWETDVARYGIDIWMTTTAITQGFKLCQRNSTEPEPVAVDLEGIIDKFKVGYQQFSSLWKDILSPDCFADIQKANDLGASDFHLPTLPWRRILYEMAATFHAWTRNRFKIIEVVTPLYYARVASFVRQTWDMTSDAA